MSEAARSYVGTTPLSGKAQLTLLKNAGLKPSDYLLEIGCGCLHGAVPIVTYLDPDHYVGIEPNEWLVQDAMSNPEIADAMTSKRATILSRHDFDAREVRENFDFVFSHSVLSHAAHWQLDQFLSACAGAIKRSGKIIASIRLSDKDSMDKEWQYPGNSWFTMETVNVTARHHDLNARIEESYKKDYMACCPEECHDWIIFTYEE